MPFSFYEAYRMFVNSKIAPISFLIANRSV